MTERRGRLWPQDIICLATRAQGWDRMKSPLTSSARSKPGTQWAVICQHALAELRPSGPENPAVRLLNNCTSSLYGAILQQNQLGSAGIECNSQYRTGLPESQPRFSSAAMRAARSAAASPAAGAAAVLGPPNTSVACSGLSRNQAQTHPGRRQFQPSRASLLLPSSKRQKLAKHPGTKEDEVGTC